MTEEQLQHGAIPISRIHRATRKLIRKVKGQSIARGMFDWSTVHDVRDIIGPITIKDQGANSSCGGQAGSYFLEIQRRLQGIKEGALSAKSIYAPIAYPTGGTTVTRLITQIGARGANLETIVPSYTITGTPLQESLIADRSFETKDRISDALTRAGYTPYDIAEDIDTVGQTIQQYGAVIFEITGQNNGTWASSTPLPPSKTNPNPLWNHFMCAIGTRIINGKKFITALQSMGPNWGDQGIQYISEDYFKSGFVVDCFTFIYDTQVTPSPDNNSIWAAVCRWFKLQWKMASA